MQLTWGGHSVQGGSKHAHRGSKHAHSEEVRQEEVEGTAA